MGAYGRRAREDEESRLLSAWKNWQAAQARPRTPADRQAAVAQNAQRNARNVSTFAQAVGARVGEARRETEGPRGLAVEARRAEMRNTANERTSRQQRRLYSAPMGDEPSMLRSFGRELATRAKEAQRPATEQREQAVRQNTYRNVETLARGAAHVNAFAQAVDARVGAARRETEGLRGRAVADRQAELRAERDAENRREADREADRDRHPPPPPTV